MLQATPPSERAADQISLADLPCIAVQLRVGRARLGFGTYEIRRILAHVRRGMRRLHRRVPRRIVRSDTLCNPTTAQRARPQKTRAV